MYTNRVKKITVLEEMLDADVYFLIHNRRSDGSIDGTMIDVLRKMIHFTKHREKAALVIQTPGGYADEAYYIGEFFREYYDKTEAYVVSDCYSGGTMIALSTDRIYLSHSGCLGPIDIQRYYAKNDKDDNWYPATSGLIEALRKAKEEKEIDESLEKTFKGKMSVLATYFKDKYTYADLVGENVKRHCLPGKEWNEVWKYLSALNFSHGTPLTYRRLNNIGLNVELMDDDVEEAIKVVIRDIEHEFGDLMEKDYLYDFFKNPQIFSPIKGCDEDEEDDDETGTDGNPGKKEPDDKHQYSMSTSSEKLAVIETSIMGFMQSREVGMMTEDFVPRYLSVISSGWEEEANMANVQEEKMHKLEKIVGFVSASASDMAGIDIETADIRTTHEIFNRTYASLAKIASVKLAEAGKDVTDLPNSEACKLIVDYLIYSPGVISFDEKLEEMLRSFSALKGIDYAESDNAMKIELYSEVCDACERIMLDNMGISDEEYNKLSEEEQDDMLSDFMENNRIEFVPSDKHV